MKTSQSITQIPIQKIRIAHNPRKRFTEESLQGLAQSIKERGFQQPIIVEPSEKAGWFELVSGERRIRAHKLLGIDTIDAIVRGRSNHNGRERFIDAILENDQREDMTAVELGQAFLFLQIEHKMTARDIAVQLGKTEPYVYNHLLLTKLEPEIQEMIEDGLWKDPRFVRGLLSIKDSETRLQFARRLFDHKVSLRGCLNPLTQLNRMTSPANKTMKKGTPAMILSGADAARQPARWNILKQLEKVPAWDVVVRSAERTCADCPLRSIASHVTCSDCGAVTMLRIMMEAGRGC